jgi:hypothetical protein
MNDPIREAFERITGPAFFFGEQGDNRFQRKPNGEYANYHLEDHWQTFQEGWEAATESAVKVLDALDKVNGVEYCVDCGAELMSSMTTTCYGCNQIAWILANYKDIIRADSRCTSDGWIPEEVIAKVEQYIRNNPTGAVRSFIDCAFSETAHE